MTSWKESARPKNQLESACGLPPKKKKTYRLWLRAREGRGVRLPFDLLSRLRSLRSTPQPRRGRRYHPDVDVQRAAELYAQRWTPGAVDVAQAVAAGTPPTAEAYDTADVQTEVAAARSAAAHGRCVSFAAETKSGGKSNRSGALFVVVHSGFMRSSWAMSTWRRSATPAAIMA